MGNSFTFVDLFAGIGGFKMALSAAGGRCVGFSEISKDAINSYCENYGVDPESNLGNITKIKSIPEHDLLTAGVPCQSWSIAGKNLGFDDDRGQLWNDTIFLLNKSKPKAFIFENVKGLVDPRNSEALDYILTRIKEAGYFAKHYVVNSIDFGVPQNRVRVFIVGFRIEKHHLRFKLPPVARCEKSLGEFLGIEAGGRKNLIDPVQGNLFSNSVEPRSMSLSSTNGFNDYFLFNDLRNGKTTIHSWDICETSERQRDICLLMLKNRRKSQYGPLDGNPLSLGQFQKLDDTITQAELMRLVDLGILKEVDYRFEVLEHAGLELSEEEKGLLGFARDGEIVIDRLKIDRVFRVKRIPILKTIMSLAEKSAVRCVERRYEFKNGKISSGLNGVNRIFMPSSDLFPTLVASDTNDFVALHDISPSDHEDYKRQFISKVFSTGAYRKITKEEACVIQGFPSEFRLPKSRARWMKLIGNSVSVPVISGIARSILETGVFDEEVILSVGSSHECEEAGAPL